MAQSRRAFLKTTAAAAGTLSGSIGFPMVSRAQAKTVVVWWNRGYYKEEDEAMIKIAQDFEKAKGVKVDISFTIQEDLLKKIIAAIQARRVPDVAFCFYNDWEVMPNNAWTDKLTETTDLIQELKPRYNERFLQVAYCYNNVAKKRAYYGVPIEAQIMHIHYWRDLLKEAGMPDAPDKIPLKWEEYWDFWKKAQDALRKKDPAKYGKLFGIGMTESSRGTDTIYNFEMALLSFGGQLLDNDGKVIADQPKNREAIVKTLAWFGEMYNSGYVPPDAINWSDGDNNANFHSKSIVMTPNPSLSIPAHWFFNGPEQYFNNMATVEWPDNPGRRQGELHGRRQDDPRPEGRQGARPRQGVHPLRAGAEPLRRVHQGRERAVVPGVHRRRQGPLLRQGPGGQGRPGGLSHPARDQALHGAGGQGLRALEEPGQLAGLRGERLGQGDVPDQRGQVGPRQGGRRGDQPDQDDLHAVAIGHRTGFA